MKNYVCTVCEWVYKPGENENIDFEDLPNDFVCPVCGVSKAFFEQE